MSKIFSRRRPQLSLGSHLATDVRVEGATRSPTTVEIATRGADGLSRRVRVRSLGDGGLDVQPVPETNAIGGSAASEVKSRSWRSRFLDRAGDALFVAALLLAVGTVTGAATLHVVASGSMVPAFAAGDVVFAVSDEFSPPSVGDIVIFKGTMLSGEAVGPFAHRIVGGDASGWVTQGDANDTADTFRSTSTEILGKVLFAIPGIGLLLEPRTLLLLLGGLVVFLLFR
jgi:signal peptidase I